MLLCAFYFRGISYLTPTSSLDRFIGPDAHGEHKEFEGENKEVVEDDEGIASRRVSFLMHQIHMIPQIHHPLFWNLMRKYPTSPI